MPRQKHLLHIFPTFAVGGSQMRFGQLARLHGSRYRHSVIALDGDFGMAARLEGLDVTVQKLDFDKTKTFQSWMKFRRTLRDARPDLLMTYNWGSIDWALVNKLGRSLRHIHIEDGFGPEEAAGQLPRRVWMRRFTLSGRETEVILPSRTLEHIALSQWKLPPARLHYIPNGIDCGRFRATARDSAVRELVIGTVATLRREKNIGRLIQAFAAAAAGRQNIRLLIVGDGPERAGLEQLARALPVAAQISFAGQSRNPEEWLAKMDIFALSSDTEQMPLGVLEAMASGLPIVATKVGDVAQMVSAPNAGLVVPPGEAFERALLRLIDDPALRLEAGQANAERAVTLFDEQAMAERYAALIA